MFDFGVIPPEVTSGRLYAGPGSASLSAAANAWRQVASELDTTAAQYSSVLQTLSGMWRGPSAAMMRAAAAPYVMWLQTTAVRAARLGAQAAAAAAAFDTAYQSAVPPEMVAAKPP